MVVRCGLLLVAAATLVAVLVGPSSSRAAFPGANGRIAFSCHPDGLELCVIDPNGGNLAYLTQTDENENWDEHYPAWSPDGRRIAFVAVGFCVNAIYVMNADRTGLERVHVERGRKAGIWTISDLAWSPDGKKLAYRKDFFPGPCPYEQHIVVENHLFTISVDGTGERAVTSGPQKVDSPAWSPDGTRIAFYRSPGVNLQGGIFVMNSDGTSLRVFDGSGYDPDWSPDGTRLVYPCATPVTIREICVRAEGSAPTRLGIGDRPVWSPDGSRILFVVLPGQDQRDPDGGMYLIAPDGSARTTIMSSTTGDAIPAWQPCRGACPPAPGVRIPIKKFKPRSTLIAKVGPGFTIGIRHKGRKLKKLVEGTYAVQLRDRSRNHSIHVKGPNKFNSGTDVKSVGTFRTFWQLKPGSYRYFCDAHKGRMHGRFQVVEDPLGTYRP
jgi:TolB protein